MDEILVSTKEVRIIPILEEWKVSKIPNHRQIDEWVKDGKIFYGKTGLHSLHNSEIVNQTVDLKKFVNNKNVLQSYSEHFQL